MFLRAVENSRAGATMEQHYEGTGILDDSAIPEEHVLETFAEIGDPLSVISRDFRLLWSNRPILEYLNVSLEELRGQSCYRILHQRDRQCPQCPVRKVFDSEKACVMERWFANPDGSSTWRELRAYPVRDRNGFIVSAIRIGFDITEEKLRRDKQTRYVEALERTLRDFANGEFEDSLGDKKRPIQHDLTSRELEVLRLVAKGLTNTEISKILCISPHTVKSHVVHMLDKLAVNDRTEAAVKAVRLNLI
jgi:PAS domain S-box-containing protein